MRQCKRDAIPLSRDASVSSSIRLSLTVLGITQLFYDIFLVGHMCPVTGLFLSSPNYPRVLESSPIAASLWVNNLLRKRINLLWIIC